MMKQILCEDCGKRYNYEKDEFCPRCGAFNQPVRTWTTDRQGNVRRVDGINEQNHAGSFVHREAHREKRVRRAKGMDWEGGKKDVRQPPRPARQQKRDPMWVIKAIFIIIGVGMLIAWILPWLSLLL